eukprot:1574241-Prorocentrum_lima.AAC.1
MAAGLLPRTWRCGQALDVPIHVVAEITRGALHGAGRRVWRRREGHMAGSPSLGDMASQWLRAILAAIGL